MEANLWGTLDDERYSDTCELWRRAGSYRYELKAKGAGALRFVAEAHHPLGGPGAEAGGEWRAIEQASRVEGGKLRSSTMVVPDVRLSPSVSADFVRIRLSFSRIAGGAAVAYEFSMRPAA